MNESELKLEENKTKHLENVTLKTLYKQTQCGSVFALKLQNVFNFF